MLIEPKQREEMAKLASEVTLLLNESNAGVTGEWHRQLIARAGRLAELVSAVTACGNQGGKATLIMSCLRCNARVESGKPHRCAKKRGARR